jgi:DNA-binding NarL/FixJ family response regulator
MPGWLRQKLSDLLVADRSYLSERELKVLQLIAEGFTSKEIGEQLSFSEATVKRVVQSIFDKLDVHSRPEAIAEAYKRELF